jgi:hypothetical protein
MAAKSNKEATHFGKKLNSKATHYWCLFTQKTSFMLEFVTFLDPVIVTYAYIAPYPSHFSVTN